MTSILPKTKCHKKKEIVAHLNPHMFKLLSKGDTNKGNYVQLIIFNDTPHLTNLEEFDCNSTQERGNFLLNIQHSLGLHECQFNFIAQSLVS